MPMHRTFVAIGLSDPAHDALMHRLAPLHREHAKEATWARPAGWHLTLAFLGEVDDTRRPEVAAAVDAAVGVLGHDPKVSSHEAGGPAQDPDAVDAVSDPTPGITAAGGQEVSDLRLQRCVSMGGAVALAVTHNGWLTRLHAALVDEIGDRFDQEPNREFRPHLTVARMKGQRSAGSIVRALSVDWEPIVWRPENVEVWVSHLGDGPATYESVATVALPRPERE